MRWGPEKHAEINTSYKADNGDGLLTGGVTYALFLKNGEHINAEYCTQMQKKNYDIDWSTEIKF